jgi:uncharacterized protein YuzB (UPF0349 family)
VLGADQTKSDILEYSCGEECGLLCHDCKFYEPLNGEICERSFLCAMNRANIDTIVLDGHDIGADQTKSDILEYSCGEECGLLCHDCNLLAIPLL